MHRKLILSFLVSAFCQHVAPDTLLAGSDDRRLDIYWIDVEGGAATLIVTPTGESILIDTGLPKERFVNRMRDAIVDIAGLRRLDHLVISHYDTDHYGGAAGLALRVPIGMVHDNGRFDGMRRRPDDAYWSFPCQGRSVVNPGDEFSLRQLGGTDDPKIRLKCIATRQQFIEPPSNAAENGSICDRHRLKEPDPSENANSMVLVLEFGGFRFFNATDLTWNLESKLVCPVDLVGEVDVYQVTHHGLDRSNNPLVVESLKPRVAVMNNGRTKGCAPEVFKTLTSASSVKALYQVHRNRRPDGAQINTADALIANTDDGESGNYIKLSVAPDGQSYDVIIPAHGHSATFQTKR